MVWYTKDFKCFYCLYKCSRITLNSRGTVLFINLIIYSSHVSLLWALSFGRGLLEFSMLPASYFSDACRNCKMITISPKLFKHNLA